MSDNERPAGVVSNVRIGKRAVELNETMRYAMWSVFQMTQPLPAAEAERAEYAAEVEELFEKLAEDDVVVRGTYDVAGFRADADVMLWIHAETSDALQDAFSRFRRTALGDFEWLLAFEADDLDRIVDLMRHLRGSETRRHVREEIPFYTGKRRSVAEIVNALP